MFWRVKKIKLNVGASPIWEKEGRHPLDHKAREFSMTSVKGDAESIPWEDGAVQHLFCSHMFEHVPHTRLENILLEFNRVMKIGGIVRVLCPDLKKIAKAYVDEDTQFFTAASNEDENIRTDLGLGGMFMNFIVSPGQDTALFDRDLSGFIAGYAHLYAYDFGMLRVLLERTGFTNVTQKGFCESKLGDYKEPLHVAGMEPIWQDMNQSFYKKNGLVHKYDSESGNYNINFKVTGFDRDPLTSLIIEASKKINIDKDAYERLNASRTNYDHYAYSLLRNDNFTRKLDKMLDASNKVDGKIG